MIKQKQVEKKNQILPEGEKERLREREIQFEIERGLKSEPVLVMYQKVPENLENQFERTFHLERSKRHPFAKFGNDLIAYLSE